MQLGSGGASICVVGRTDFSTGIGAIAAGTAEALARSFPVCFRPLGEHRAESVTLPSGRVLPVLPPGQAVAASVFCDVLWNGVGQDRAAALPQSRMTYAWLLFDSDRLPRRLTEALNRHADAVIVPSPHLADVARDSGLQAPTTLLPIPLLLDRLLTRRHERRRSGVRGRFRFGSLSAFHPRKGHETLIEAFLGRYGGDETTELWIHSNLVFGGELSRLRALLERRGARNVRLSDAPLDAASRDDWLAGLDVLVSCSRGEGYGIGPREGLALGLPVVASAVGGHRDLGGVPGVFLVPPSLEVPARYPEIDGGVFGVQHAVSASAVGAALGAARTYVESGAAAAEAAARRAAARTYGAGPLASSVAALIDPSIAAFRGARFPPAPAVAKRAEALLGRRADAVGGPRRQVCPAYDAGFFSIFNAWISHTVWQEREDRCHAVLPDWDMDRLVAALDGPARSFCYGQPGDGNLWLKLFQPLFGASDAEMDDAAFLWRHATAPADRHNQGREPNLTYVRAYTLYRSPEFARVRQQYHRSFARHVRLRPALQAEVDAFAAAHLDLPIRIAAHVRHPSHTVEQPGARIAPADAYIHRVRETVCARGGDPDGPGWAVFVATDQDAVLHRFRAAFGARAVFYPQARRTRPDEDAAFAALPAAEQNREGHQLQHLVAATPAEWSWRMAWEVVRDAFTMARCQALLHVVSNVSTAVSYMNPEIEMIFCEP